MKDIANEVLELINEDYILVSDWDNVTAQSYIERHCPEVKNTKVIASTQALFDSAKNNNVTLRYSTHDALHFKAFTGFCTADISIVNEIAYIFWDSNSISALHFNKVAKAFTLMDKFISDWQKV